MARKVGIQKGVARGTGKGIMFLCLFIMHGVALWYGTQLVLSGEIDVQALVIGFFVTLMASFSLGNVSENSDFRRSFTPKNMSNR